MVWHRLSTYRCFERREALAGAASLVMLEIWGATHKASPRKRLLGYGLATAQP